MKIIIDAILNVRAKTLRPPPKLNLVEWADTYRYLSPEASSEPGRWETSRVEVCRGPMLAVTEKGVEQITIQACTQLLKTELILNICGYFIHQDPSPILVVQPTGELVETWSKDRLDTMVRDTPAITDLVKSKKSRDTENTIKRKSYPGGHLSITASNSPSGVAARPIRLVLFDEINKFPVSAGVEGDVVTLATERSATFWNCLIVCVCSPTVHNASRITTEYENSDMRIYEIPCPHCEHKAEPEWKNVKWPDGKPEEAKYYCSNCGVGWSEPERLKALTKGTWRATEEFKGHAGFKVNKLCSPWENMGALAKKFVKADKALKKERNPELMKAFINTQLAETWKEPGEAPQWEHIYNRREDYPIGEVPSEADFLTCSVDVQKNRLEYEVKAWSRDKQNWSIEVDVLMGLTSTDEPWKKLDLILDKIYPCGNGLNMGIYKLGVDSGYNTAEVYNWCRKYPAARVYALKGMDGLQAPHGLPKVLDFSYKGKKMLKGITLWPMGSSFLKQEFYGKLNIPMPVDAELFAPGFCHFPKYESAYFKQLTAEQLVVKINSRGYSTHQWKKIQTRNEALDLHVMNRALFAISGGDRIKNDTTWKKKFERQKAKEVIRPKKRRSRIEFTD